MSNFSEIITTLADKLLAQGAYILLEPSLVNQPPGSTADLETFVFQAFNTFMLVAAVSAVVMIMYGGFLYLFSASPLGKGGGKEKIQDALIGLVLAFVAYALLYNINPQITDFDSVLDPSTLEQRLK